MPVIVAEAVCPVVTVPIDKLGLRPVGPVTPVAPVGPVGPVAPVGPVGPGTIGVSTQLEVVLSQAYKSPPTI